MKKYLLSNVYIVYNAYVLRVVALVNGSLLNNA